MENVTSKDYCNRLIINTENEEKTHQDIKETKKEEQPTIKEQQPIKKEQQQIICNIRKRPSKYEQNNNNPQTPYGDVKNKEVSTLAALNNTNLAHHSHLSKRKKSFNANHLHVSFFNARSIANKLQCLHNFVMNSKYDFIFIVETWLHQLIEDQLVCPTGYNIIRRDRENRKGGGILVLYKSKYNVIELRKSNCDTLEYICIDLLELNSNQPLRFYCSYLPPDVSRDSNFMKIHCENIMKHKCNTSLFYIIGDFNMPYINWASHSSDCSCGKMFLEFCLEKCLKQHISEPTTTYGSLLDLIMSDHISTTALQHIEVLAPLSSTCDHNIIEFSLYLENVNTQHSSVPPSLLYDKGDYSQINGKLETIKWDQIFSSLGYNVQLIYDFFLEVTHLLIKQHVPLQKFRKHIRQPKHIKCMAKKKNLLYKRLKQNKELKEQHKKLSYDYDKEVSKWYDYVENKVCSSQNPSSFYKYANKKMKTINSLPPLIDQNGNLITDDQTKANIFNEVFQSVYCTDNGNPLKLTSRINVDETLNNILIEEVIIKNLLQKLAPKTSKTPDGLPAIFLKKVGGSISKFLCMFFQLSINTSTTPWQWRTAFIIPVYKKAARNNPLNYRPISLTSSVCRLLEKIICTFLLDHLFSKNLLSTNQHGFLPRRSSSTQLLSALNDWHASLNSDEPVSVIYTDLAKAFDKVSHVKLLEVVKSYGIEGNLYNWIKSFLSDRKQHVSIKQSISESRDVLSGVPQGSVMGPLLFLMYIDDVSKLASANTSICLFADDTKVYSTNQTNRTTKCIK